MKLQIGKKYFYIRRQSKRKKEEDNFETENFNWEFLGLFIGIGEKKYRAKAEEMDIHDDDIDSYIKKRWAEQRKFFSNKSAEAKKKFIRNQVAIIVFSALMATILTVNFDDLFGKKISDKVIDDVSKSVSDKDSVLVDAISKRIDYAVDSTLSAMGDSVKKVMPDSVRMAVKDSVKVAVTACLSKKIASDVDTSMREELSQIKNPHKIFNNRIICALLSLLIIVISGIDKLKQHHEEWTKNRKASELLKSEICRYKFGVGSYFEPDKQEEPENPDNPKGPDSPQDNGGGTLPPTPTTLQSSIVNKATAMVYIVVPPENSPEQPTEPKQDPLNPNGSAGAPSNINNDSEQIENMENMDNKQPGISDDGQHNLEPSVEQQPDETGSKQVSENTNDVSEQGVPSSDAQSQNESQPSYEEADEVEDEGVGENNANQNSDEKKGENDANQKSDEDCNSRIQTLFDFLDQRVHNYWIWIGKFRVYKKIKSGLANYVRGLPPEVAKPKSCKKKKEQPSTNNSNLNEKKETPRQVTLTPKEVLFVHRINEIIEKDKHWLRRHNYYRDIKDEMTDYCTNSGAYVDFADSKDSKSSSKPTDKPVVRKPITKQDRMFVDHVETIISNDVKQFLDQKSQLSDFEQKYTSYVDMHYENLGKKLKNDKDGKDDKDKNSKS